MKRTIIAAVILLAMASAWLALHRHVGITGESVPAGPLAAPSANDEAPPVSPPSQPNAAPDERDPAEHSQQRSLPVTATPPVQHTLPVTTDFVAALVTGPDGVSIPLPDGRNAGGTIDQRHMAADGSPAGVSGKLTKPGSGHFLFRIQPAGSPTGPVVGAVAIDNEKIAFRVMDGPGNTSILTELPVDQVVCRNYAAPPVNADQPQEIPADHPANIPIPAYQNGVIPLQSRPGAAGVVYLDFDGQTGPHENWGNFVAAPSGASNTQIKNVWIRVCEDFSPFNLNITTDLQVYLNAPETSRQRCIITPTTTAAPGAGGVAWVGSFAWSGDTPCWSFYSTGKNGTEVISHEIGHTLGLSHDGRTSPSESYYLGHGTDPVGWAPIMGAGYYKNLSQWSNGEYAYANNSEDDLSIISGNFNVGYRTDDAGSTHAAAALLEIFASGVVNTQGTIEKRTDIDAFRFTTTGGAISLAISPVATGPDLDILASIYDASGNLILSDNPDTALNATLATTLAAGEYTVRVDGVGRGNALSDGYTDYASLGQYTITGTIIGAMVPDRFTISENPSSGAVAGTPNPRNNHAGAALAYSISAGNTGSAFAIDSVTGAITVATPSVINYETLSTGWTNPPSFNLTVNVVDSLNPSLNESLRVVIAISNVNEPPAISGVPAITVISHTVNGTLLSTVTGSDPDQFDFPIYSISSGNSSGKFAISQSGGISVTGDLDASVQASWPLVIRATDHGSPALTADLPITVTIVPAPTGYTPGLLYHTIYDNITGSGVSSLTANSSYPTKPTREVRLTDFTDTTQGDNYGSAIRAWMIAPYTGKYQFWIAADNSADLNFSAAGNPATTGRICYLTSSSNYQQWTNSSTQASSTYTLAAGQVCYIEALHMENSSSDHLSVAWEIKDTAGTTTIIPRSVIPGRFVSRHLLNYAPVVPASTVSLYRNNYSGHSVTVASASDLNTADSRNWSITGGNQAGIFAIDSASGQITVASSAALAAEPSASVTLALTATDNGSPPLSGSGSMTFGLLAPGIAPAAGLIQEFWDYVVGTQLSNLYAVPRYPNRPDHLTDLTSFSSGSGISDNYGARIRAFVIPPASGSYTFYLASDNNGSLLLSPDSSPANAVQIASVATFSSYQSWNTYTSQTSAPVTLTAGQRYFIEGRVKESTGGDHLSVAWTGPTIPSITVIGDADTEPYDSNVAPDFISPSYQFNLATGFSNGTVAGTVAATDSPFEEIRYAIISGNSQGAFGINPVTGVISVANASGIASLSTFNLQVGAQDSGHGRHFAPRETLVPVDIHTPDTNLPPVFTSNPVAIGSFPAGLSMAADLAPFVSDPGDTITFTLVSGPPWLTLSGAGILTGTPGFADFGPRLIVVSADDGHGQVVQGSVAFTVSAPAPVPGNAPPSVTGASFQVAFHAPVGASVGNVPASDPDAGQILSFTLPRGNEAGCFAISPTGEISVATDIPQGAGPFQLIVVATDNGSLSLANYATVTINVIAPVPATIGIGNLTATFDGSPHSVLVTADPPGLQVRTTYDELLIPPVHAGNHNVQATIFDAIHTGSASATQTIQKAPASVIPGDLAQTYDGTPRVVTVVTNPPGLSVALTYDGTVVAPAGAGNHSISAMVIDPDYTGSASGTLAVAKAIAGITFGNLVQTFDGSPKPVSATTDPAGISTLITYNGNPDPPSAPGSYPVQASINDVNHEGSTSGTLLIRNSLIIAQGQIFVPPDEITTYQFLMNDGTLVFDSGSIHVATDATNHGILRLTGDAVLDVTGTFTNTGFIDIINWNGTLPPGLANTGTILDRSAVRILSTGHDAGHFTFSIPGYDGHFYQLEETPSPAGPWTPLGGPIPGSGSLATPPALGFSPAMDGPGRFYRVRVTPAP